EQELRTLFSNVEVILQLNQKLLRKLEKSLGRYDEQDPETQCVSQCFIEMVSSMNQCHSDSDPLQAPYMTIYGEYCANYVEAAKLLATLKQEKTEFAEWVRERASRC